MWAGAVETVRDWMEEKESLDQNMYWGNIFMLVFLTWAVLLYIFIFPPSTGVHVPFDTILTFLVLAGYSLILFNQTEILRKRLDRLDTKVDVMD